MPDALVRIVFQDAGAEAGATRVANALRRLERTEPTLALRQLRGGLEALAAEATGLDPRLTRLASTLSLFGIGGAVGIVAVGGFAAIAFEVKTLVGQAAALDAMLLKLNTSIASGPAATLFKAQAFRQQAADLPGRGFLNINRGFFQSLSPDALAAGDIGEAAQRATFDNAARMAAADYHRQHDAQLEAATRKENERLLAIGNATLALDKAKLSTNANALVLFDFAAKGELLKIALSSLDPPTKTRIENLTKERQAIERANLARDEALRTVGQGPRAEAPSGALDFFTLQARTGARLHLGDRVPVDQFGRPIETDLSGLTDLGRVGLMGAGGGLVGASARSGAPEGRARDINLAVGAAMTAISGLSQGSAGGALGGLGGAATALSGLSGISKGAAGILGPVGIGLSAVSSIISLFGGSKPATVMIDGYSSKALTQQQQLMLALTGFKGLSIDILSAGGDVDRILYALGRQSRTDGNMRVPPGGR